MIDIHCHLLPGIDDGARNWDESLQMARLAAETGTTQIILTPHIHDGVYINEPPSYDSLVTEFRQALEREDISLIVHGGGEVHLSEELPRMLMQENLPFIGSFEGESVLLLEMPHGLIPTGAIECISWLRENQIRPVIAHPERNKGIMRQPDRLTEFIGLGCGFQVTANSLLGGFGEAAQKLAWQIIDADWCFAVASDAHNLRGRKPVLAPAYQAVEARNGLSVARKLFVHNPEAILQW